MKWASSLSERQTLDEALAECEMGIRAQLGEATEPDLVLVFTSPRFDQAGTPLAGAVRDRFGHALVVGCTGAGVIGGGQEVEETPALSVTVAELPGVSLHGFHVESDDLPTPDDPPGAWERKLGVEASLEPHFIVLAEPYSLDGEALLAGMDFAFPAAAKIGGLASGGRGPGTHALYLDDGTYRTGAVGVALSGNVVVDTVVAQGCRPIGEPMRITRADRNLLLSLDEKPPIEMLQSLFERLSPRDQALAQRNLFMGIAMDPLVEHVQAGDFLIRNIVGVDPSSGAVAVGALLREGQVVQFHVRDAETSAEDLRRALAGYAREVGTERASAALLFQCTGRGRYLYGSEGHDSGVFSELIGALPVGGFFCNGEIGPVSGSTYLHGYTSSFAIFRERAAID